jgi:hypothetical protein
MPSAHRFLERRLPMAAPLRIQEYLDSVFERAKENFFEHWTIVAMMLKTEEEKRVRRISHWLDELARRRAVWCWNLFEGESNAMWHLYGSKGVAIKSTVGVLKKALANSGCARRLIAPVRCVGPSEAEAHTADENFEPQNKASWPFWLMRP